MKVMMINGPNLNLLGTREREIYGSVTLEDIEERARARASELGLDLITFQSNHEGEIIERIQGAKAQGVAGILLNPGGYTHSSVAIRDALLAVEIPFIEIHLSNVYSRESFRQKNLFTDIAIGIISGLGAHGYILGLEALHELLGTKTR
jgi:3-dehydroquinate dehydratase II